MPECPTCGSEFSSEMGVKTHHWQVHDEKIGTQEKFCNVCGKQFEVPDYKVKRGDGKYCSHKCLSKSMDEKVTVSCEICGSEKKIKKYRTKDSDKHFCSFECQGRWMSKNNSGKNNPSWKDDVEWIPYGAKYKRNRIKAIYRDCGKCVICGSKNIEVHHITPRIEYRVDGEILPKANDVDNLITLCRNHHKQYEGEYTDLSADEFESVVLSE